ncbi:MAG: DnaA regulatory inactivator Hda [Pseudomonadota bacterium]
MRQLILDIRPDAPPSFANFLAGANAEVLEALRARTATEMPFAGEHVVYLWGEEGVGKTHLLRAWAAAAGAAYHAAAPLPEPTTEPPLLAVDEVERLPEEAQIRLFSLINAAREQGGRLLVAGLLPPAQLAIRADLATRLAQGLVFRLHALADRDKAQALTVRAEARGMQLPEEVIHYLLTHCRRDLPGLLATVDALDAYSLSRKRQPTVPLLKEMLQATAGD